MRLIYLIFFFLYATCVYSKAEELKIGIIGSGIGGTSAAYRLLHNTKGNIKVDMFEKESRVGGRVYSIDVEGKPENMGASFFIKENQLIYDLIKELNVPHEEAIDTEEMTVGVFRNRTMLFQTGSWKLINLVKVLWRYGLAPIRAKWVLDANLKKFFKIYDHLRNKTETFENLGEFLDIIHLRHLLGIDMEDYFTQNSISQKYTEELFNGMIAGIYNQNKEINAFASFVTLAGTTLKAFKITGGNSVLIETIVKKLKSYGEEKFKLYLDEKVEEIYQDAEGKMRIVSKRGEFVYDYIILANPLLKSSIKFRNFEISERDKQPKLFQVNELTDIRGEPNPEYFGLEKDHKLPKLILSVNKNESESISEIMHFRKVESKEKDKLHETNLYKIQADKKFSKEEIDKLGLFKEGYEITFNHHWDFAYPKLLPVNNETLTNLPNFRIHKKIFHLNAIELAASCMEMSMISAMNAVKIILNENKIDYQMFDSVRNDRVTENSKGEEM